MKTSLSPIEKIKVAYLYHWRGIRNQQTLTEIMDCTNSARINEAIKAVEKAVGLSEGGYKDRIDPQPGITGL